MSSERLCRRRYRKWIDRAFVHALSKERAVELERHLQDCTECSTYYDRLGRVDQTLAGAAPLSTHAHDRVLARVLADSGPAPSDGRHRPWLGALAVGLGGALAAVVAVVFIGPTDDGFRARGPGLEAPESAFGLELFCVESPKEEGEAKVIGMVRAVAPGKPIATLRCPLHAELQLVYSSGPGPGRFLVVWGTTEHGTRHWYAPALPEEQAVPLQAAMKDEPLPFSTRLSMRHEVSELQVVARFVSESVTASRVTSGDRGGTELRAVLRIEPTTAAPE